MIHKNQILSRQNSPSIVYDLYYNQNNTKKPLVVFCHGYKGFKDWGSWNLVAKAFSKSDCFFVKFNFSYNGGTIDNPIDFPDLEAFAENNYTKELTDLKNIIDFLLHKKHSFSNEIDTANITLIGHSRGGGIVSIMASEDKRITKLITLASVSDYGNRFGTEVERLQWKKDGVKTVLNGRTKQQMPHNYQFYEDFKENQDRLNIQLAVRQLEIPHLIIHAKNDKAVSFSDALDLHKWSPSSKLLNIENSNHVFNAAQPWEKEDLPMALNQVVEASLRFVKT